MGNIFRTRYVLVKMVIDTEIGCVGPMQNSVRCCLRFLCSNSLIKGMDPILPPDLDKRVVKEVRQSGRKITLNSKQEAGVPKSI